MTPPKHSRRERRRKSLGMGGPMPDELAVEEFNRFQERADYERFMRTGVKTDRRTRKLRRQRGEPVDQPHPRRARAATQWGRNSEKLDNHRARRDATRRRS